MGELLKVPEKLDELLEPQWLTAALGRRYPGIQVKSATLGPIVSRISTNARFRIDCDGGVPEGLSPDLCAKGYFTEVGWPSRFVGEREAAFYRDLVEGSGVRTLRSVYADSDPETHHGVVITEDVAVHDADFLDALSPFTPDQAAASLEQYAVLHGRTWNSPAVLSAPWLESQIGYALRVRGLTEIVGNFDGPIGRGVPDGARDAQRLVDAYAALPAIAGASPVQCILHGDAHVGNLFLDAARRPNLVDWQLVQRGPWYIDIGYHITSALTVEDRRASERDLLRHYLDRLTAEGGDAPSFDDAFRSLAYGIVYGFFLWAITLKVNPEITAELLKRLGAGVVDHGAFDYILGD